MPENYICKDCNYASDVAGFCPHCDMPLEPLDPTKLDETTGEPATYASGEINAVEKDTEGDIDYIKPESDEEETEDDYS